MFVCDALLKLKLFMFLICCSSYVMLMSHALVGLTQRSHGSAKLPFLTDFYQSSRYVLEFSDGTKPQLLFFKIYISVFFDIVHRPFSAKFSTHRLLHHIGLDLIVALSPHSSPLLARVILLAFGKRQKRSIFSPPLMRLASFHSCGLCSRMANGASMVKEWTAKTAAGRGECGGLSPLVLILSLSAHVFLPP